MVGEEKNGGGGSRVPIASVGGGGNDIFFFSKIFLSPSSFETDKKKKNVWSKLKSKSKWGGKCGNSGV